MRVRSYVEEGGRERVLDRSYVEREREEERD